MKIKYEPEDDILNIWISKKPYDYAEEENGIITHYSKDNVPVYIEIIYVSRFFEGSKKITFQPAVAHKISK